VTTFPWLEIQNPIGANHFGARGYVARYHGIGANHCALANDNFP
jgi:hypothetical protein